MAELLANVSVQREEINIILLIGIGIFGGTVGARLFQRLSIPGIVGYVAIGILLGPVLRVFSERTIEDLEPFNLFALGVIGFLIGGELQRDIFVRFGKQVVAILLFEGLAAFLLVGLLSFGIMLAFSDWRTALAVAVVFGAICAATDPASTVGVLWEYKARGPLTAMLTAIVALDDALALTLYAVCVSIAGVIIGHGEVGFVGALLSSLYEIAGSVLVGVLAGFVLDRILRRTDEPERMLVFTISSALLITGVAINRELDVIISTMALGVTLVNIGSKKVVSSFDLVRRFSSPIYVLFFVLVGARLTVSHLNTQVLLLVAAYIAGSVIGKTSGAWLGAVRSGAVPTIRRYLGFCLYQQGTIAIALLLMASSRFEGEMRETMLAVIIGGVFVLQLGGPFFVRIGTRKAGEAGLNISEDDLIRKYTVADVMNREVPIVSSGSLIHEVLSLVSTTDGLYYPVVDGEKNLIGAITLDGIKRTFATQELNDWLIALDIVEPLVGTVTPEIALSEAIERTHELDIEQLPVITATDGGRYLGILDTKSVHRRLSAEVLEKQKEADKMYGVVAT